MGSGTACFRARWSRGETKRFAGLLEAALQPVDRFVDRVGSELLGLGAHEHLDFARAESLRSRDVLGRAEPRPHVLHEVGDELLAVLAFVGEGDDTHPWMGELLLDLLGRPLANFAFVGRHGTLLVSLVVEQRWIRSLTVSSVREILYNV